MAVLIPKRGLGDWFQPTILGLWTEHDLHTDPKLKVFLSYHKANPHVYVEFLRLAREAKVEGKKKIGIGALTEVVRWNIWMQTSSEDQFKINNNHRAYYARLIMFQEGLHGLFEVREQRK